MNYKKTFWMNVLLVLPFSVFFVLMMEGSGLEIFTSKLTYTSIIGLNFLYILTIAPILLLATAYALNTNTNVTLAKMLNVLQLLFVVVVATYAFTEPTTMSKKIMRMELIVYIFVFVLPSIINLRALAKIGR
jgi:hypothetical protein